MLKEYDALFLLKTNIGDEKIKASCEKLSGWITDNEGTIDQYNEIGVKDLQTEFNKMKRGYYLHIQFTGTAKTLETISQQLSVNEDFFRHLIVLRESVQEAAPVEA